MTRPAGIALVLLLAVADAHAGGLSKQLLLSSAWCSFSYNQHSGTTRTKRVMFAGNGSFVSGSRGETYSSGRNGSVAGQHDGSERGQWRVEQGELFMAGEGAGFEHVPTLLKRNSNGAPIIVADRVEYMQCN